MGLQRVRCSKCGKGIFVSDRPEDKRVYVCNRKSCRGVK